MTAQMKSAFVSIYMIHPNLRRFTEVENDFSLQLSRNDHVAEKRREQEKIQEINSKSTESTFLFWGGSPGVKRT